MNWQLYRGYGRTKSAARRAAVQQAVSCSVQLPDPTIISHVVGSTFNKITDFTVDSVDPPTNESATTEDVFTHTLSTLCQSHMESTSSCFTSTDVAAQDRPSYSSPTSPARRRWFNAAAVLHDVRPSARYQRQTIPDHGNSNIHATVIVDGQHFDGFGTTWRAAKRNAASQALFHILQLRHLTSDLQLHV